MAKCHMFVVVFVTEFTSPYNLSEILISVRENFLGAFAQLRKRLLASPRLFVCLSAWTGRLQLDRFPSNLMFEFLFFENLSSMFKFRWNLTRIIGTLREDQSTFLIISHSVLLRMGNVSDKSCRENQNTHFVLVTVFPPKIVPFMNADKYGNSPTGNSANIIRRMRTACWVTKATNTLSKCCFSTETVVTRTLPSKLPV